MKKIILFADINDNNALIAHTTTEQYILYKIFSPTALIETDCPDFVLVDIDKYPNIESELSNFQRNGAKVWAYSNNTDKNFILSLYTKNFDNVIKTPTDFNYTCQTIVNPDNNTTQNYIIDNEEETKNILIINDNTLNADLLFYSLKDFNYICTLQTNIQSAICELNKQRFDLIIIDSTFPNTDSTKIANYIQKSPLNKNTPFIFVSSSACDLDKIASYKMGAIAYLERPFDINITRAQIKNILKIKELQNFLCKENKLLENLIKFSKQQSIITKVDFTILTAGSQYLQIFKGENFLDILQNEKIQLPNEEIKQFISDEKKNFCCCASANEKTFKIEFTKIFSANGVLENFLIVIDDITEQLIHEEQKETFIATLTHDLKAPIRAEENILQQLIDKKFGALSDVQMEIITELLNSRKSTKRMIDNILTRYKISADQFEIFPEMQSYKTTINDAINSVMYLINAKEQTLTLNDNTKEQLLSYDKTAIQRVLINIIANASEYTPTQGKITINIDETPTHIVTSVSDTGYGVEPKDLKHIFDKNVTLAKKYRKVGSGLGLYISKSIIDAHGGIITAQSTINKGSTFTFTLNKAPKALSNTELKQEILNN